MLVYTCAHWSPDVTHTHPHARMHAHLHWHFSWNYIEFMEYNLERIHVLSILTLPILNMNTIHFIWAFSFMLFNKNFIVPIYRSHTFGIPLSVGPYLLDVVSWLLLTIETPSFTVAIHSW
jgi:hypothetical protein